MSTKTAQATSHVPDPTPSSLIGSFTEPDTLQAANTQDTLLPPDAFRHQSAPSAHQRFLEQPYPLPEPSMTHNLSFRSMEMVAGQSPQPQSWDFPLTDADNPALSPLTICSEIGLGDASFSPESSSAIALGTSTQAVDDQLRQRGDELAVSQPENTEHHSRKRKRIAEPKDPRAAKRLQRQRQSDAHYLKVLEDLVVPKGEADVMKKDRLRRGIVPRLFSVDWE
jgi:hypothetical protein